MRASQADVPRGAQCVIEKSLQKLANPCPPAMTSRKDSGIISRWKTSLSQRQAGAGRLRRGENRESNTAAPASGRKPRIRDGVDTAEPPLGDRTGQLPIRTGETRGGKRCQGMRIRMLRRVQIRTSAGFAVLSMALAVLAGCATDGKVKAALVADKPPRSQNPRGRDRDGREGSSSRKCPQWMRPHAGTSIAPSPAEGPGRWPGHRPSGKGHQAVAGSNGAVYRYRDRPICASANRRRPRSTFKPALTLFPRAPGGM